MNETLRIVLSLSLSGAFLILILYLLRPLIQGRLSKQWQYYIWLVVIARLLLPFAPETNIMGALFQTIETKIAQTKFAAPPDAASPSTVDMLKRDDAVNGQGNVQAKPQESANSVNNQKQSFVAVMWQNLWLVWLVVALILMILMIRKITIYQSFVNYIRAGCAEVPDINLLERFGTLVEQNKIKTGVELQTNNLISSPLLIGFFRPCIVLPCADLSPADFEYTILHELVHHKRRDMFYKWLVQLAICVHWFNPLVYRMGKDVGRACELSCDEAVIRLLDLQGRRAYGDTLLNAMGTGGSYENSIASVTLSESKERLKERLDAIMSFKKASRFTAAISIALCLSLCFGATTVGAYSATPANAKNQQVSDKKDTTIYSEDNGAYYLFNNGATKPQSEAVVFSPDEAERVVIPISLETISDNTSICIGEIPDLANITSMDYNITCESEKGVLSAGLRNPTPDSEWFFRVEKEVSKNNDSVQSHFGNSHNSLMGGSFQS